MPDIDEFITDFAADFDATPEQCDSLKSMWENKQFEIRRIQELLKDVPHEVLAGALAGNLLTQYGPAAVAMAGKIIGIWRKYGAVP